MVHVSLIIYQTTTNNLMYMKLSITHCQSECNNYTESLQSNLIVIF